MKATNWRLLEVVVTWHHRANCNSPLAREYPTRLALFGTATDMTLAKRDCKTERLSQTLTLKCNQVEMKRETHPPPQPLAHQATRIYLCNNLILFYLLLINLTVFSAGSGLSLCLQRRLQQWYISWFPKLTDDTPVKKSGCVVVDITQAAAMD